MVGVGRDFCGSSSPNPLSKQGHLQQAAQDLIYAGLEYIQRRRIHNLSGQPVPVLRHPQREEVLPHVQLELPKLQFVPVAPCPVTGHTAGTHPVFRPPVPPSPSWQGCSQSIYPQVCINTGYCPDPFAGPCTWPYWTSWGSHGPTP